jgi:hypothetical protein
MHSKYLTFLATGLVLICAALIIRKSFKPEANQNPLASARPTANEAANKRPSEALHSEEMPRNQTSHRNQDNDNSSSLTKYPANPNPVGATKSSSDVKINSQSVKNSANTATQNIAPKVGLPPEPTPTLLPQGIQLAEDVKLPAVILAINAAERNPQNKMPAPVAAAMHGIVDTFYQELAESVAKDVAEKKSETSAETTVAIENDTVLIHPGPAVERARDHANQMYRALFGDAAYNQMTMNAVMESQLPVEPVTGEN